MAHGTSARTLGGSICAAALLATALAGCGSEAPGRDEDAVGALSSALCTDPGAPAQSGPFEQYAQSPTAHYGSAACSGRFLVEATNTHRRDVRVMAIAYDDIGNRSDCEAARVNAIVYGLRLGLGTPGQPAPLVWEQIGAIQTDAGAWQSYTGRCDLPQVEWAVPNSRYTAVRVAARAYRVIAGGATIPLRVEANITRPVVIP